MILICKRCWLFMALLCLSGPVTANTSIFDRVGHEVGVSPKLLWGIALAESYRSERKTPWPWTINDGRGRYFESKESAIAYAYRLLEAGDKNFDVGLMQVNWKWNGHRFESLEQAFDPVVNVRVAAGILKQFEHEPAFEAVGRYHCPGGQNWCRKARKVYADKVVQWLVRYE